MNENKFWLSLWLGLALIVSVSILGILHWDKTKTIKMAELGYEKVTIVGHAYTVYQKVRD